MGTNHTTRTVLVPSGWMRLGAGRFGSCVKPTGPRRAGAGGNGSTVALNCKVATSTPAPEINATSQRAVPPGAALQSVTCRLEGATVVDVVLDVEVLVVVAVVGSVVVVVGTVVVVETVVTVVVVVLVLVVVEVVVELV